MTAQQVADVLMVRGSTVEDYARCGVLPYVKIGRHHSFIRSQVGGAIAELADRWGADPTAR